MNNAILSKNMKKKNSTVTEKFNKFLTQSDIESSFEVLEIKYWALTLIG